MIESSFAQQYNIRIRRDISNMEWAEFCAYLSGLNGETPLGNIVRIRTEKDFKTIQNFSKEEKRIRSEWINRKNKEILSNINYNEIMKQSKALSSALVGMCKVNKPQEKAGDKM